MENGVEMSENTAVHSRDIKMQMKSLIMNNFQATRGWGRLKVPFVNFLIKDV